MNRSVEQKTETVFEETVNAWKKERKEFISLKIKLYFQELQERKKQRSTIARIKPIDQSKNGFSYICLSTLTENYEAIITYIFYF